MPTASAAFLDALASAGVSYLFANFGSDHPAMLDALAEVATTGRPAPRLITCPAEMVALSAAQGVAQVTGRAQAVLVHVECGTQSLGGAVHNVARARTPVLIFAGASPFTQAGELPGSRNEFIHWLQDVRDQRGIVRGYVKYDNEIRTGKNLGQIVFRALQIAHSDPPGPVYLVAPREVLEETVPPLRAATTDYPAVAPQALAADDVRLLADALSRAHRPLVVTSYLGRNRAAPAALARVCRRLGIGVLESVPSHVNYPTDDPLYQGSQWNAQRPDPILAAADLLLVIDSDVPWIPLVNPPRSDAAIYHIDVDPLKPHMPLWQIAARRAFCADAATALGQLADHLDRVPRDDDAVAERTAHYTALHDQRRRALAACEQPDGDAITPEYLTSRIRRLLDDRTLVLNEGISSYQTIGDHLLLTRPGSMLASGGSSLGWNGGAAIGVKLARPDHTVISLTGDGSYLFSQPSVVHWMARRYATPFLQVIYNNGGWKSPRLSMLALHPSGPGSAAAPADLGVGFAPAPDHAGIAAAAGGAFARTVRRPDELDAALEAALDAVRREQRAAVLDVQLPSL
ncbi:MAG TPA: thiamine pyrophosphate-requiring protein [Kofleriaceae bacterium]|jgi:acetolactate synthase-1/2/3 large subunit|nr:thiamine pyrophosphate-requiring protein [Kofleriaceae bacterium]